MTYKIISALGENELERSLNDHAEQGFELQNFCVGPSTAFVAVLRRYDDHAVDETKAERKPLCITA